MDDFVQAATAIPLDVILAIALLSIVIAACTIYHVTHPESWMDDVHEFSRDMDALEQACSPR